MTMDFANGSIEGVIVAPVQRYSDERGWLAELFRNDMLAQEVQPAMGYVSVTLPGVLRGPHEHVDQADLFVWLGPGEFKVTLWDNRASSPTFGNRMELYMGQGNPGSVLVPKGVVHCYRCISEEAGWVFNVPNRLYAGEGKHGPVDEIRHEAEPDSPFVLDELQRRAQAR